MFIKNNKHYLDLEANIGGAYNAGGWDNVRIWGPSIYRHPRQKGSDFTEYMNKTLSKLSKENKQIFITGGFNYNFLNTKNFSEVEIFIANMCSNISQPHTHTQQE